MTNYLANKGRGILRNGYNIIPIQPGEKFPSVKDWRGTPTTKTILDGWVSNGRASHGVGLTTDLTPFIDLDISHHPTNRYMVKWCVEHIGPAPERIGNAPKCGLLYRVTKPFSKITSKEYVGPDGNRQQVEVLGVGQQFVAYADHPDTHKPYIWMKDDANPESTFAKDCNRGKTPGNGN